MKNSTFLVLVVMLLGACQTIKSPVKLPTQTPEIPPKAKPPKAKPPEIIALASGRWHNCVLSSAHKVYCWDANKNGQLGKNDLKEDQHASIVSDLKNVSSYSFGVNHTCALASGNVYCWGGNKSHQVNQSRQYMVPSPVLMKINL